MEDVFDFPSILREARGLFEARTKSLIDKKERKNYRQQNTLPPKYALGIKDNEIVCAWVGNFRKDRIGRPKWDGQCTVFSVADIMEDARYTDLEIKEGFTSREWDRIGLSVIHLHEQLK